MSLAEDRPNDCTRLRINGSSFEPTSQNWRAQCAETQREHGVTSKTHFFPRFTVFGPDELILVTPHKTGSKYSRSMFARAYNCSIERVNGEVYLCGHGDSHLRHWTGGRTRHEVILEAKKRKSNIHVAVLLRDPLDRLLSMYNHFGANSASGLEEHCCADNPLASKEPAYFFSKYGHGPKSFSEKKARFVRWLSCLGRLTDSNQLTRALSWRHFQPVSRYALADDADTIGRVEDLTLLVDYLGQRLPILKSRLQRGGGGSRPEPWMSDPVNRVQTIAAQLDGADKSALLKYKPKHRLRKEDPPLETKWIAGHEWANKWSISRCELRKEFQLQVESWLKFLYSSDWGCFGGVLPPIEAESNNSNEILAVLNAGSPTRAESKKVCRTVPKDNRKERSG